MNRLAIMLALLAAASSPAAAAERRFSVNDFDRIVVEGPYIVRLIAGRSASARASGGQAGLDRLSLDTSGQTLRIRRNRHRWGGNPEAQEGPLTIVLVTRSLRSARLIGPGRLEIDRLEGLRTDLSVEGSGRISVAAVDADNLSLGVAGAGAIELSGRVEALTADIQGTGSLDAAGLIADHARITSASSGAVAVSVEREATITALGLGTIDIGGRPSCTLRGSSAQLVRCGNARAR
ncbi:head GIN domain-containing protein [Sphingosinicella terrae]|uniref:head GIN domain-containing protein n=1 Tax=Sphingosinicella terrae TaxID=2172047 RepID=UPI0013B3F6DE|nr:head GIN domain-containing protein [Sphingosinicella terrae]